MVRVGAEGIAGCRAAGTGPPLPSRTPTPSRRGSSCTQVTKSTAVSCLALTTHRAHGLPTPALPEPMLLCWAPHTLRPPRPRGNQTCQRPDRKLLLHWQPSGHRALWTGWQGLLHHPWGAQHLHCSLRMEQGPKTMAAGYPEGEGWNHAQPLLCPLGLWVSTEAVPFTLSASHALPCSLSPPHVSPPWHRGDALGPVDRICASSLLSDGDHTASQSSWPKDGSLPSSHKHPLCA